MSGGKVALSVLVALVLSAGTVSTLGQVASLETTARAAVDDPPQRIAVESASGDVRVVADPGADRVSARGEVVRGLQEPTWSLRERDGVLVLASSCAGVGWPSPCSADWTLTVPAGRDLDVRAVGDVDLAGAFASAAVESVGGDVEVVVPRDGATYRVSGQALLGERSVEVPLGDGGGDVRELRVSSTAGDVRVTTR